MNEPAHLAPATPVAVPATPEPTAAAPVVEPTPTAAPVAPPDTPPTVAPTPEPPVAAPTEPVVQATPPAEPTTEPPAEPVVDRVVPKLEEYVLPEGVPQELAQFAVDNDMTQAQLDASLTQFTNYVNASENIKQTALKTAGEDLVKTWGVKADSNLSLVRRALRQNDPKGELSKVLETSGYGNHPAVLNFFLRLGDQMQEGGFLRSSVNTPPGKRTAAQTMFGDNHPSATN